MSALVGLFDIEKSFKSRHCKQPRLMWQTKWSLVNKKKKKSSYDDPVQYLDEWPLSNGRDCKQLVCQTEQNLVHNISNPNTYHNGDNIEIQISYGLVQNCHR